MAEIIPGRQQWRCDGPPVKHGGTCPDRVTIPIVMTVSHYQKSVTDGFYIFDTSKDG